MAAGSSPGGFVVATVTNPGSFMAAITHPTGNGYCRDGWVVYSVIGCDPMGCLLSVFCCIVCDIGIVTSMKVNHNPADFARNDAKEIHSLGDILMRLI